MTDLNARPARGPRAVALAALLSCAAAAHADPTTYLLNLSGGGTHFLDAWECPGQRCDQGAIRFDSDPGKLHADLFREWFHFTDSDKKPHGKQKSKSNRQSRCSRRQTPQNHAKTDD